MEWFLNMLKPRRTPQQLLKYWQRRFHKECRRIDRQITDVQNENKSVHRAIREAAKRNDIASAKELCKEIVSTRKVVNRLQKNKAQLNSLSMHVGESVAMVRTTGHLSKSTEVMKLVDILVKAPEVTVVMQTFSKEMAKAGVIEEVVDDDADTTLVLEEMEEEVEEEVDKVLGEIAFEIALQFPDAVRESIKLAGQEASAAPDGVKPLPLYFYIMR